jgi:hypothetical protein
MDIRRGAHMLSLIALPVVVVCSLALAQPQPGAGDSHKDRAKEHHADKTDWKEKYKDELRDHPRLAHALVDLHVAKEHLEKAPHEFGGHRADAVKSCDEAIKQIELALKFDAKHDENGKTLGPAPSAGGDKGDKPAPKK